MLLLLLVVDLLNLSLVTARLKLAESRVVHLLSFLDHVHQVVLGCLHVAHWNASLSQVLIG